MKILGFIMLAMMICMSSVQAQSTMSSRQKSVEVASQEKVTLLLNEIHELKAQDVSRSHLENQSTLFSQLQSPPYDHCDDNFGCVLNCVSRYPDGTCSRYGNDFCGPHAACVPQCESRFPDGVCTRFGPDHCGPRAKCIVNCESRYSDGACSRYGKDICF